MQAEIISIENAEKLADYPKQVEKAKYWKTEYDKVVIMLKNREKNYLKTNAEKDKKIKALQEQLYEKNNSQSNLQRSLFK